MFDIAKQHTIRTPHPNAKKGYIVFSRKSSLAMSITDLSDGRFGDVNEQFLRLFECRREDILGQKKTEVHLFFDAAGRQKIETIIHQGPPFPTLELSLPAKNGGFKEIAISFELAEKPRERSLLTVYRDITEQKQRDHELQLLHHELETFNYTVSHDLLNPLRHINSFVQLIQQHNLSTLDDMSLRYLKIISESVNHMGHLIEDLLIFSRMGKTEILMTTVDMEQLVREVINELGQGANVQAVEWNLGNLPKVNGDPTMLRVLLTHLIANALNSSQTRRPAKIEIDSLPGEQGHRVFFVRDNGVGFDHRQPDALQGAFQGIPPSEEFEGASIKLATVRRIIQRHRGNLWAEGSEDQGTIIYFSIPKENNSPSKHS